MYKHLSLLTLLMAILLIPACICCKKKEKTPKKVKKPRAAKVVKPAKVKPVMVSDLYDYDYDENEEILLAENDENDEQPVEDLGEEIPNKF